MGWNGLNVWKPASIFPEDWSAKDKVYFVHSYAVPLDDKVKDWVLATTNYGSEFVSVVQRGNVMATQFHPEKSGKLGLKIIKNFLCNFPSDGTAKNAKVVSPAGAKTKLAPRVIACLDVRTNDDGDLVVTKGEQYDVRESQPTITNANSSGTRQKGAVRNLGKPVELARRYYEEGADEIVFLNITSFRNCPLKDLPMMEVLRKASENIFVPLTVGGGIRDLEAQDDTGNEEDPPTMKTYPALDVASAYFRSGADKVSIGSDAVYAAENFVNSGGVKTGKTSIEMIAKAYGCQAVVISVDPKRAYVQSADSTKHHVIKTKFPGPNGEEYCWYQCTIKGGREVRDFGVYELVCSCEALGAGEIMLNCIDKDGTNSGFDLELIAMVKSAVKIPVIASSGAGHVAHFSEVFREANANAALAAGIFHRSEVSIGEVKEHLLKEGFTVRK